MKYTELLEKNCIGIEQAILNDMKKNWHSVKEIKENKQISVPESPILYRWWFPESFVEKYLQHKELKELLGKVEKATTDIVVFNNTQPGMWRHLPCAKLYMVYV